MWPNGRVREWEKESRVGLWSWSSRALPRRCPICLPDQPRYPREAHAVTIPQPMSTREPRTANPRASERESPTGNGGLPQFAPA
jgi:hypothetical protein